MVLAVVGVAILSAIAIMLVFVINKITKTIQKLTDTIVTVTGGDFTADIEVKGRDELAVMAGSIQELSNTVLDNSANVQRDSRELASTAEVLKEHISKFTIEKEEADFAEIQ